VTQVWGREPKRLAGGGRKEFKVIW
jgi:hypothetical protein